VGYHDGGTMTREPDLPPPARAGNGDDEAEGDLVRVLQRAGCPAAVVEEASERRWVLGRPRILRLLLRHPACPRPFALEAIQRLGWSDLAEICRGPRTAPRIRLQAERRIVERLSSLSNGERATLARMATRPVIIAMLLDNEPRCIAALLDNPRFTETEALRLLATNRRSACVLQVIRHTLWGQRREVMRAALCATAVPLGVALGVAAALSQADLARIVQGGEAPESVRSAIQSLLERRQHGGGSISEGAPS
jgi:hypothetical protein